MHFTLRRIDAKLRRERRSMDRKANLKFANEALGLFDHNFSGNRILPTHDGYEVHTIGPCR